MIEFFSYTDSDENRQEKQQSQKLFLKVSAQDITCKQNDCIVDQDVICCPTVRNLRVKVRTKLLMYQPFTTLKMN